MNGWRLLASVAIGAWAGVLWAAPAPTVALCPSGAAGERGPWHAELAATPAQRARGFRDRPAPDDHTLIYFLYRHDQTRTGFWMYQVEVPLDIAFISAAGEVLAIRTMVPCLGAPSSCPVYHAPAPYRAALEGAAGVMARRGLAVGDTLRRCVDAAASE